MKTWMTAVGIVAVGVGAIAAVVTMAAAEPGYGANAHEVAATPITGW